MMFCLDRHPPAVRAATVHLLGSAGYLRTKDVGDPLQALATKFGDHAATVMQKLGATNEDLAQLKSAVSEGLAEVHQKMARAAYGGSIAPATIGEQFVHDTAVKAFMAAEPSSGKVDFRTKATLTSATTDAAGSVGAATSPTYRDGIVTIRRRRTRVRDLIPTIQIAAGNAEWPSMKGRTASAAVVAEAAAKPESDVQFEMKTATARVIAHWMKASRQVLSDAPQLRGLVDQELLEGLALAEENQLLNGDGTGQNLTGLIPAATAYTPGLAVFDETLIDMLGLAFLQLAVANYTADAAIVHPSDWMRMRLTKDSDGNYILGSPQTAVPPSVFGVPLVATTAMTADKFLVGEFAAAATIYDRWAARIELGYVNDDLTKNLVTILAEERLALGIKQAQALVYGDFGLAP